ncbi:VCBS repeat-containing protein [Algoriphagus sp. CAU 1675]|uniref:FG-GAP repeat domain-containing protein n=1 Tax=Algoriphagus sp. CAU 1675 TaxID=3032597 RepID=UPI0023DBA2C1|nr:VCBS repeat-containing protein [Algoriphagus sp. CAU 1675]MDF2157453.1 VCBS repeat-containing protein [Algoriphagus sp. CAU 1675]
MRIPHSLSLFALWIGLACQPIAERKQPVPTLEQLATANLNLSGEQLANFYCANCHLKPEPEVLDKATWEKNVLPDMRMRMGLYLEEDFGRTLPRDMGVPEGIYSDVPLIKIKDWEKLRAYYLENAPNGPLPQKAKIAPQVGLPGFQIEVPKFDFVYPDLTTMASIDPESGQIWVGHRFKKLFVLDGKRDFKLLDSITTNVAPVDIRWKEQGEFDLLTMGLMDPSNDSLGTLSRFSGSFGDWTQSQIRDKLIRPVQISYGDLNGDGLEDQVICQFGNHIGKVSVYFADSNSTFKEEVLKSLPGATRTILDDFDGDGDLDVLGMLTQAKEGIYLWENDGQGNFEEKRLLSFQPAFGSSDFRFKDVNGDGAKDLILVNGDNADLSQILKPYHGLRIFINNGNGEFEEDFFYPMYGATGLSVEDFDQDGDLDIFVISFFPDKNEAPGLDLIYFRQEESGEFNPFYSEKIPRDGLLTIASGDIDGDQDLDVVIGKFKFDELYAQPKDQWSPILVIRNNLFSNK